MRKKQEVLDQIEFLISKLHYNDNSEITRVENFNFDDDSQQEEKGTKVPLISSEYKKQLEEEYGKENLVIKDDSDGTILLGQLDALEWVMGKSMDAAERYCEDNPEVCGLF